MILRHPPAGGAHDLTDERIVVVAGRRGGSEDAELRGFRDLRRAAQTPGGGGNGDTRSCRDGMKGGRRAEGGHNGVHALLCSNKSARTPVVPPSPPRPPFLRTH